MVLEALLLLAAAASAASPTSILKQEEAVIPKNTTAPPSMRRTVPGEVLRCERHFIWKGKTFDCDSFYRVDGEGLRAILSDVPDAVAVLNSYQRQRRLLRTTAYIASGGIAVAAAAFFVSRFFMDQGSTTSVLTRNVGVVSGLGIAVGAFTTGLVLIRTNESKMDEMVRIYNQAKPDTPIQLQFSMGFNL